MSVSFDVSNRAHKCLLKSDSGPKPFEAQFLFSVDFLDISKIGSYHLPTNRRSSKL